MTAEDFAARRRRTALMRNIGKGLMLLAVLAILAVVFLLFIETDVIGASSTGFTTCGGVVDPVAHEPGLEADICGAQLRGQAVAALISGLGAVLFGALAIVVLRKHPA